jgi:uncharacterized RDD family membrane protein YckC
MDFSPHLCAMKYVGIGTRVINFVVDTLLIFFISYILYQWRMFYVQYYNAVGWPFYYFFWADMVAYYLVFEFIFSRTPAKWLTMTKVVNATGKRPAFWQVLVRSVLRLTLIVDCVFIPFTDRTLHDFATKTAVVEV